MQISAVASRRRQRIRACAECDLVVQMPALRRGESATCPRCSHHLLHRQTAPLQTAAASCLAALVMLIASLLFPFVSFELQGKTQQIGVMDTAVGLLTASYPMLALVVVLAIVIIPGLYLLAVGYLHCGLLAARRLPGDRALVRMLRHLEPWMMADVFLIGVLVSMIKIAGQADVSFGLSFWAFAAYVLLLIKTISDVDFDALWQQIEGPPQAPFDPQPGVDARSQSLIPCQCCGQLLYQPGLQDRHCPRCGAWVASHRLSPLQNTYALLLAAVILYIPANIYPIMITTSMGETLASTIFGGVVHLWEDGSWPIALIIFVASIVVPVVKMLALLWLCLVAGNHQHASRELQHRLFRITEFVGRWSMVDIFVMAILVALIQRGNIMTVLPGPAALAFCAVVIITMLAARAFDPRVIWSTHTSHPTPPQGISEA